MRVSILPVGEVEEEVLRELQHQLRTGGIEAVLLPAEPIPRGALHKRRRQYRAPAFLELARRSDGQYVLAVTDVDLFAEPLNFVFGQAEMGGRAAVISLSRLRSADRLIFHERVLKEALHELGHNAGLDHCPDEACVMHFSNTLADTDRKGPGFCRSCEAKLGGDPFWRSS